VIGKPKISTRNIPPAYNQMFSDFIPSAFVTPTSGADVAAVINLASKHNVFVAVRSFAGHSYIGQSTIGKEGIVMSLEMLKKFSIEASSSSVLATVGAGLPLLEVYSRLAMHEPPMGLSGGTCPSVGKSGLVSGGGEGMSSASHGMTSDHLVGLRRLFSMDISMKRLKHQMISCLRCVGEWVEITVWLQSGDSTFSLLLMLLCIP
jgi:FAD/FMN-containing dehydrogenase